MKFLFIFFVMAMLSLSTQAKAGWLDNFFGYQDYDDCILGELEGNESKEAVREIKRACRSKFPSPLRGVVTTKPEQKITWKKMGQLKIIEQYWRQDFSLNRIVLYPSYKNVFNQDVHAIKAMAQRDSSCNEEDAISVGFHEEKVRPKNNSLIILPTAHEKLGTRQVCLWLYGYEKQIEYVDE